MKGGCYFGRGKILVCNSHSYTLPPLSIPTVFLSPPYCFSFSVSYFYLSLSLSLLICSLSLSLLICSLSLSFPLLSLSLFLSPHNALFFLFLFLLLSVSVLNPSLSIIFFPFPFLYSIRVLTSLH